MPAAIELADVFRAAGPAYRAEQAGHLSLDTLKVMAAIEVGHDLLQRACLAAQVLDLVGGRGPSRVTGQPLLASFQELLGPSVVHRTGDALAPAQLGNAVLTAQAFQHDADRLLGRELTACGSTNILDHGFCRLSCRPGRLFHLRSWGLR
ncbi:hypothetical protein A3862_05180 [Methylobacterium sp. XJLW]|nr:hypothetical protein A3862_05180 [Methylobacterium sp. XJLW]